MNLFLRNVDIVHSCLKEYVSLGDLVIDATSGNGYDTLFLAKLGAKVTSFDIQQIALDRTKSLLEKNGVIDSVKLILDSNENITNYFSEGQISAISYNLGYLPDGDESITTTADTTINSLKSALPLLKIYGVISIVSYRGHNNGREENLKLDDFLYSLDEKDFLVIKHETYNRKSSPPIVYFVKRLK